MTPAEPKLLLPSEADRLLRYPTGTSAEMARAGRIPCIVLPCGEIRFLRDEIDAMLTRGKRGPRAEVASAN